MASKLEFKWRYIWDQDGLFFGTNDRETANHFDDEWQVIDVHKGEMLGTGESISEAEMPDEDEEEE